MVHKKKRCFIRSARCADAQEPDQKRLRKMSRDEIQAYLDAVEPIEDAEVDQIMNRIYPRIANAIESADASKAVHRHAWPKKRIIAIAACAILILPVIAQALGLPIWETIVSWTSEHLNIDISQNQVIDEVTERKDFSEQERKIWEDDTCEAFLSVGICPALPTWKPEGYLLFDLSSYRVEDEGYGFVNALYQNEDGKVLNMMLEILPSDSYEYGISVERDEKQSKEFIIDGIQYYLASNIDTNIAVWRYKNVIYQLSGPLSFDDLEKMIRSIQYD